MGTGYWTKGNADKLHASFYFSSQESLQSHLRSLRTSAVMSVVSPGVASSSDSPPWSAAQQMGALGKLHQPWGCTTCHPITSGKFTHDVRVTLGPLKSSSYETAAVIDSFREGDVYLSQTLKYALRKWLLGKKKKSKMLWLWLGVWIILKGTFLCTNSSQSVTFMFNVDIKVLVCLRLKLFQILHAF